MADLNKVISVNIDDNASAGLKKVDQGLTKVTQSTKNLSKETKTHTQSIVDNGGAMGILNELTGGLAMTFKDAGEAIGLAGISLKSFKGIMLATGIGALVLAVGYLASNWEAVADAITGAADAQVKYNLEAAKLENTRRVLTNINNTTIAAIQLEKEQAIARGASNKELLGIDTRLLKAKKEQLAIDKELYDSQSIINDQRISDDEEYQDLLNKKLKLEKQYNKVFGEIKQREQTAAGRAINAFISDDFKVLGELKDEANQALLEYERINENFVKRNEINQKLTENELQDSLLKVENQQVLNSYIDKTIEKKKQIKKLDISNETFLLRDAADSAKKARMLLDSIASTGEPLAPTLERISEDDTDLIRAEKFQMVIDNESVWYDQRIAAFENFNKYIKDSMTLSEKEKADILLESSYRQIEVEQEKYDFIINASAQAANDILSIASAFGEKSKKDSKKFAIASVIIEQAKSIGIALNNLVAANAKAVLASPLSFGQPWVGINTATTALGIAGGIASAAKSISAINSETLSSSSPTGGGGGGPQAQFNIVGASGTNQLAATIGAQQNQPVNAYVVGTDMTTQQSLDRNRIQNATFLSIIPWIGLFIMFL
jgi:hypothetical protein